MSEPEKRCCETCKWWGGFEWESGECGWIEAQPVLSAAVPEKLKQRERYDGYNCPTYAPATPDEGGEKR